MTPAVPALAQPSGNRQTPEDGSGHRDICGSHHGRRDIALSVLFNVVLTYRLASRGRLEEWRRNEERPIVARVLTFSADALAEWERAEQARREWIGSLRADPSRDHEDTKARDEAVDHWRAGSEVYDKLRFEVAQLDLFAGRPLRDVATKVAREHESPRHWLRPASGADGDLLELLTEQNNKILWLHTELVEKARADLGVDRGAVQPRLRSLRRAGRGESATQSVTAGDMSAR